MYQRNRRRNRAHESLPFDMFFAQPCSGKIIYTQLPSPRSPLIVVLLFLLLHLHLSILIRETDFLGVSLRAKCVSKKFLKYYINRTQSPGSFSSAKNNRERIKLHAQKERDIGKICFTHLTF